MATRENMVGWVYEAVNALGGRATLIEVAKHLWTNHQDDFQESERLLLTWQYEMRWAAQCLRDSGKFSPITRRGYWELAKP